MRNRLGRLAPWLGALACLLMIGQASAQSAQPTVLDLWPASVAENGPTRGPERVGTEGKGLGAAMNISRARIEVYKPAHPNGTAVIIMGGGGYFRIQIANESMPVAQWLSALGVTPVVLYYRLPVDGWKAAAPFQDGQRAVRVLRAHAAELGIDPHKIGVIGLSAGGNLAAITETRFADSLYEPIDAADKLSARPDFAGLIYPVISLKGDLGTTRSRRELNATQKDADDAYSGELHVTNDTPPTFLAHAADDPIANVGHSLVMFNALKSHNIPVEMHIFETGGHGWGLGTPGSLVAQWPRLFATWARSHGFMTLTQAPMPFGVPAKSQFDSSVRDADANEDQ
ncbi:alpha/beta hydrolase [Solimonas marina]|uniref:Alpha/beta hydrolase n=1 Tax=Solimonas marina TaxID=2714601 RepID=A0A969W8I5_9GAMM|nr:alpha/beta hydrolase [Solimonas marina]NKF21469.1 alpha/beta hydrolase [Solimonas marina]